MLLSYVKLWLDNGDMFGKLDKGFMRMNIALPKEKLEIVMKNLYNAFKNY